MDFYYLFIGIILFAMLYGWLCYLYAKYLDLCIFGSRSNQKQKRRKSKGKK